MILDKTVDERAPQRLVDAAPAVTLDPSEMMSATAAQNVPDYLESMKTFNTAIYCLTAPRVLPKPQGHVRQASEVQDHLQGHNAAPSRLIEEREHDVIHEQHAHHDESDRCAIGCAWAIEQERPHVE